MIVKIALTTSGKSLDALVDSRFGRAPGFLIYDLETKTFSVIDNEQNQNASQGAGIQAAETIVRSGVRALVTGHCGPKAFRVLSAAGIAVYTADGLTVAETLSRYVDGTLAEASAADVDGHW